MELDPGSHPLLAPFVARLPAGLASYPQCRCKTEVHEAVRRDCGHLAKEPGLPAVLRAFLDGTHQDSWMSEVAGNCLSLLVHERVHRDEAALYAWRHAEMTRLFHRPLNRALMLVFSPTLVLLNAARRWGAFHEGSSLRIDPVVKDGGTLRAHGWLEYPPGLYDHPVLLNLCASTYRAALDCAKAREVEVSVTAEGPERARFAASWRA